MTETLKFSKIGLEDLEIGTGTFEVDTADGRRITLNQINLASFIQTDNLTDTAVMFTDGNDIGQNSLFTFNKTTTQLTRGAAGNLVVGSASTGVATIEANVDGAASIRINNNGATVADTVLEFAQHDIVDWHIACDDSTGDNLTFSRGTSVSSNPSLVLLRGKRAVQLGTQTENTLNDNGLTINTGSADDEALSLQNTDVAHGITDLANTSTYMYAQKANTTDGGALIRGFSETIVGFTAEGYATTEDTTDTSGSEGAVVITGYLKSGTGATDISNGANLFTVANNGSCHFLIKGNGDLHATDTTFTALDDHNDIELIEALRTRTWPGYREQLGDWVDENLEVLKEAGVVHGERFISYQGMQGLIVDALRQVGQRLDALESGRVAPIKRSRVGQHQIDGS